MNRILRSLENYCKPPEINKNGLFILYAWFLSGFFMSMARPIRFDEAFLCILAGIALYLHYRNKGRALNQAKLEYFRDLQYFSPEDLYRASKDSRQYSRKTRLALKEYLKLKHENWKKIEM